MTPPNPSVGSEDYTEAFLRILPRNRDNRYTARKLDRVMREMGFNADAHARFYTIRTLVRKLRLTRHLPILSDPEGFWFSENPQEIEAWANRKRDFATTVLAVADALTPELTT